MRVFLGLFTALSMFGLPAQALTLDCNFTNYSNSKYSKEFNEDWIPRHQVHVFNLKKEEAYYNEYDFKGKISHITKKRIHWRYEEDITTADDLTYYNMSFSYIFLRKSKRVITSINLTHGLQSLEDIKGTCKEIG
jgi:hypothetical protein